MGDGRIAESGTHEELLAKGGKYAAMWNAEQKISAWSKVKIDVYKRQPYAYLKKYKMNLAAQWLSDNKMKIVDIALELGYSNASKFAKAFQSVYGMLPKDYRKK